MPSMEITKIFGAILAALIVVKVSDLVGGGMGRPQPLAKPAYLVEGAPAAPDTNQAKAESGKPAAKSAPAAAIGPLLAAASPEKGKAVARKCSTCHSLEKGGKAKVGPVLWGIVGAKKAAGSFSYSGALKGLGGNWDYAALDGFLANPKAYSPGNKMSLFTGIKKDADRAALILYLRSLSDSPVPLP